MTTPTTTPDTPAPPEKPPDPRTRRYTPEDREYALAIYRERGLAAAHHETGVSRASLRRWAMDAGLDPAELAGADAERMAAANRARQARCDALRLELREMWLMTALALLERVDEPHIDFKGRDAVEVEYPTAPAGAARDLVIAAATALDKYRLEVGEATERREDVPIEALRAELARRRDELAARREQRSA